MGDPLGPKYILHSYMDPLGYELSKLVLKVQSLAYHKFTWHLGLLLRVNP